MSIVKNIITIIVVALLPTASLAVSTDDHIKCAYVYGALFEATKQAQHGAMLAYAQPRLKAVLPFIEDNEGNASVAERVKIIARRIAPSMKKLETDVRNAIVEDDEAKLKQALQPVFSCDAVFGIRSLPLPVAHTKPTRHKSYADTYADGVLQGCIAKQHQQPTPYSEPQLNNYCSCVAKTVAKLGITARTTENESAVALRTAANDCLSVLPR